MTSMVHLKTATIPVNFIVWALKNNFVVMQKPIDRLPSADRRSGTYIGERPFRTT